MRWMRATTQGAVERKNLYLDALQPPPSFFHFLSEPVLLGLGTSAGLAPESDQTHTHKMYNSLFVGGLIVTYMAVTEAM